MPATAYLRLCRLPNVFTAACDVVAGIALARDGRFEGSDLWLVAASGSLYAGGMALNDFFDRAEDARERPERPIPSGQVSARAAALLGFGLLLAGVAASFMAGRQTGVAGAALAGAILLYDAGAKSTTAGPLVMGVCRLLNVGMGLSVAVAPPPPALSAALPAPALLLPVALGLYTMLLTALARGEVGATSTRRSRALVIGLGILLLLYAAALMVASPAGFSAPSLVLCAYILVRGSAALAPVWRAPEAPVVGRAIGAGIRLMPGLDAAAVACAGHPLAAAAVLAIGAPAHILGRRFAMS
jgi:4-hydroxybenzoate polyprenyltransferase